MCVNALVRVSSVLDALPSINKSLHSYPHIPPSASRILPIEAREVMPCVQRGTTSEGLSGFTHVSPCPPRPPFLKGSRESVTFICPPRENPSLEWFSQVVEMGKEASSVSGRTLMARWVWAAKEPCMGKRIPGQVTLLEQSSTI